MTAHARGPRPRDPGRARRPQRGRRTGRRHVAPGRRGALALTALPRLRDTRRMGPLLAPPGRAGGAASSPLGAAGLLWPTLVPARPGVGQPRRARPDDRGASLYALLADRAMRTFALTRRRDDLLVAVGCAWLAVAAFATLTAHPGLRRLLPRPPARDHGRLLLGVPVARDLRRRGASRPLVGDLTAAEGSPPRRRTSGPACARSWSASAPTTGRPRATRAASRCWPSRSARRSACRRRRCATSPVGGLLHDIGKLSIGGADPPQAGRARPTPSTPRSSAIPRRASSSCARSAASRPPCTPSSASTTSASTAPATRTASPAADLAVGPRILAVCDVYDALVSDRVYREAWSTRPRPRAPARAGGHGLRPGLRRVARPRGRSRRRLGQATRPGRRRAAGRPRAGARPPPTAGAAAIRAA